MKPEKEQEKKPSMSRRNFLKSSAAAGAGLAVASSAIGRKAMAKTVKGKKHVDDVHVALIGCGLEGNALMDAARRIPGVRFKAVCDIWDYNRKAMAGRLKSYGHVVNDYVDFYEMLEKEVDYLDAVIVATPDWMHAEHANASMEAGLDVYCEKEMSNSLAKAKTMVETQRKTGRILQIGHQRRSNPRYIHAVETLILKEKLLGRMTHAYGQWNRAKAACQDIGCAKKVEIPQDILTKYGYDNMRQLLNWRVFKKYGGGPIVDLGSHQIDIFSWVFGANPRSVLAGGGTDFHKQHEWYDNVMTIFDYENAKGEVSRAMYQVLTTTSHGGFAESLMGEYGTIEIAEVPAMGNSALREVDPDRNDEILAEWNELVKRGLLRGIDMPIQKDVSKDASLDVRLSPPLPKWPLPIEMTKLAHQPHLENFFDAMRLGKPLNCPVEVGYETAVAVLAVNDAVAAGTKHNFKPEDFHA